MKYPFDYLWVYYWALIVLLFVLINVINGLEGKISLYDGVFELFLSVLLKWNSDILQGLQVTSTSIEDKWSCKIVVCTIQWYNRSRSIRTLSCNSKILNFNGSLYIMNYTYKNYTFTIEWFTILLYYIIKLYFKNIHLLFVLKKNSFYSSYQWNFSFYLRYVFYFPSWY